MKRVFLGLLLMVILISLSVLPLSSCKEEVSEETSDETTEEVAEEPAEESTEVEAEEEEVDAEPAHVRLASWGPETDVPDLIEFLEAKAEELNIDFEYQYIPNENFDTILNTQMAAGEGPDILNVGGSFLGQAAAGYFMDLTGQPFVERFHDKYLERFRFEGQMLAIPSTSYYAGILYNKKIFSDNGIDVPKTWDEFLAIGDKLDGTGIRPFVVGAKSFGIPMWPMFGTLNVSFYSKPENIDFDENFSNQEVTLVEGWMEPLEKYFAPLIEMGYLSEDMNGLEETQAGNEFALEKAAMMPGGVWFEDQLQEENPDLEYAIMPYPSLDGSTGWVVGSIGSGYAVNPDSKEIEASLKILDALSTAEGQTALSQFSKGPSGLKGLSLPIPEIAEECAGALDEGHLYAAWTKWPYAGQLIEDGTKGLQMYIAGSITLNEYLEMIDERNAETYKTGGSE